MEVNVHEVEAAVSSTLPMSMLMGTDMPALPRLVTNMLVDRSQVETALAVTTRAQKKTQDELESSDRRNEKVCPKDLEEVQLPEFDDDTLLQVKRKSSTLGARSELNVESTNEKAERKKWMRCPPKSSRRMIRPWRM